MSSVLRWLLLIPFACLVAMGTGLFALMVASVASPAIGLLIGGGIEWLLETIFGFAENGVDPAPFAQAAFGLAGRLGFSIIVAPVLFVAIASEVFRLRSGLIQSGVCGLLAALLPLGMLGLARTPTGAEVQVLGGLVLVGAATGFVYWLIAGRGAGRPQNRTN
ncbi:MAG: hypothetical protein DI527_19830 [Chelatococcus sp.]|nr:MAG: hypothetical protein DI527_19830 [Chelatococcus sp.]